MLNKLSASRNSILFIELAGLLHDIGKLSKAFLEYRQKWQDDPKGYDNDPHEHNYLEHEVFKALIPSEFNTQIRQIDGHDFCQPDFSIVKAIHSHVRPDPGSLINLMLKAADGVDAAIDRNNPLWSAEQKGTIFKSNVFGYEGCRPVSLESQEEARKQLYTIMKISDYFKNFDCGQRSRCLKAIENAFEQGLADTTRPANDTTLWEHSYAVASILKVLAVHNLLNDVETKIYDFRDVRFGILGIGWDGMRFLSYGQKIGDIVGRKKVIDNVTDNLRILIESKYPIGNEIYSDDDGIYFIVPVNLKDNLCAIWNGIKTEIYKDTNEISKGEIQPKIFTVPETKTLTSLAMAIQKMRAMIPYPFDSSVTGLDIYRIKTGYSSPKTICPICRLRPVEHENEKKKLCKDCRERRSVDNITNIETVFMDEIVDNNRRAALIVARFGLDEWLNGNMVRSLFVTEAEGIKKEIESLGKVKQFEKEELDIKAFLDSKKVEYRDFNYGRIKADIDSLFYNQDADRAKNIAFIYDRRVAGGHLFRDIEKTQESWKELNDAAEKEGHNIDIYSLLNAKTPTPSTILDAWDTTKEFIENIPFMLKSLSPMYKRLILKVQPDNGDSKNINDWGTGTIEAEIVSSKRQIELLYGSSTNTVEVVGETFPTSNNWQGSEIKITDKSSSYNDCRYKVITPPDAGRSFIKCRTITSSPKLFMTIVPADRAIEISALIYQKYIVQFGKVMGRLPFSIGNIFFGHKMPMFVVLDAGKRMVANFDRLGREKRDFTIVADKELLGSTVKFHLRCDLHTCEKALTWQLPHKLGNCDEDYHHPYFMIDAGNNDIAAQNGRSTFFKRDGLGDLIHFSQINSNDKLTLYPNYYDFEFLDSNARRHDITLDKQGRRRSSVASFKSKPFLLDELAQKIIYLWDDLFKGKQLTGLTDTKLRNLQSLWLTKHQEWVRHDVIDGLMQWRTFIRASLVKEFDLSKEQQTVLHETIEDGLFFDTLELYLGILKERVG